MEGLIIDDNRNTADALQQMLGLLDLPARTAYGSAAAMSVLASSVPQFICLDINMPGVDGTEVLAYIRREPRLMKVPVVIITSDDQPETRQHVTIALNLIGAGARPSCTHRQNADLEIGTSCNTCLSLRNPTSGMAGVCATIIVYPINRPASGTGEKKPRPCWERGSCTAKNPNAAAIRVLANDSGLLLNYSAHRAMP